MSDKLPEFKIGQKAYYIQYNHIYECVIKAVYRLDNINIKYLVEGTKTKICSWMMDAKLYRSINELFTDLKSCIYR